MARAGITRVDLRSLAAYQGKVGNLIGVSVDGYDALLDKVESSLDNLEAQRLKGTFMDAAKVARDAIKQEAPYDPGRTKGYHLRDAVFAAPGKPEKPNALVGVDHNWKSSRPNAPHAVIIEYGTGPRMTKSGAFRGMGPAHPFFRVGLTRAKPEIARIVIEGMRKAVKEPFNQ